MPNKNVGISRKSNAIPETVELGNATTAMSIVSSGSIPLSRAMGVEEGWSRDSITEGTAVGTCFVLEVGSDVVPGRVGSKVMNDPATGACE